MSVLMNEWKGQNSSNNVLTSNTQQSLSAGLGVSLQEFSLPSSTVKQGICTFKNTIAYGSLVLHDLDSHLQFLSAMSPDWLGSTFFLHIEISHKELCIET